MEQLKLNVPINTEDVIANVSDIKPISAYDAKKIKGVWPDVFPNYTSPTLDDNDICAKQLRVPTNQKALKINDVDFRINPLKDDISSLLIEDVRQTVEQKFHTKKYMIRLNWDQPTCLIFGIPTNNNSTNNDSTAPLEFKSTGSVHHHDGLTSPATPTPKPKMPVNNENITRKQLEELVNRLVKEREEKIKELYEKKLLKQKQIYNDKLKELKKQYNRQLLQREQPKLQLPKNDQHVVDWVNDNWKYLEPAFKHYANSLYIGHNESVHGGKDGKGDQFEAKRYKQQAINIMALQFKEFFNQAKQKSPNAQPDKDKRKPKGDELGK